MTRSAHIALHRALDEARFGPARTLDLRSSFPTPGEAVQRAEPWLRERQMAKAGEVLVITGRGLGSPGGVSVVRAAVSRLFSALKRKGVVATVEEHTPGSFVVRLAPVRALFEPMRRSRRREPRLVPAGPKELQLLSAATRATLRGLAVRSLQALGAPATDRFVRDEMVRQLATLSSAIPRDEKDRQERLRSLISSAADAFDDAD
jgi:hypothetical protein